MRLKGITSRPFPMEKGVKQGDCLSPLLFITVMDEVMKTCKARTAKSVVGMWNLRPIYCQALAYADDLVLIADTEHKLQQAVIEWVETLKERGMRLNYNKTKVMMIARTEDQIKEIKIESEGKQLHQVESYEYFGTVIHQTGKIQEEIRKRIQKTTKAYYSLSRCVLGKEEVEKKTKTRMYKTVIEPILTYGSESWTMANSDTSMINAMQMKSLRRIVKKTRRDRVRNERIREDLRIQSIQKTIEDKQLSWFGHVKRMDVDRKVRQFMEARPIGRNPVGRPRTTWEEEIKRIASKRGKTWSQLNRLTEDRVQYSRWIRGNPLTPR